MSTVAVRLESVSETHWLSVDRPEVVDLRRTLLPQDDAQLLSVWFMRLRLEGG